MAKHEHDDAERQQLREWLPLAANGTLSPELLARLEAGLSRHPDLGHELLWLQTLRRTVHDVPLDALPAGDLGWSKLERRMAAGMAAKRRPVARPRWSARLSDWLQANFAPVLVATCVLMVSQTVLIGTLVRDASTFEAAGGKSPVAGVSEGLLLHVTVRGDATERQLRDALLRLNATIVAGPSALGIYTLRMPANSAAPDARALAAQLTREAGSVFESAAPAAGE